MRTLGGGCCCAPPRTPEEREWDESAGRERGDESARDEREGAEGEGDE